jgi:hypothetical protein
MSIINIQTCSNEALKAEKERLLLLREQYILNKVDTVQAMGLVARELINVQIEINRRIAYLKEL